MNNKNISNKQREHLSKIVFQEIPRDKCIEIPNIVHELLRLKEISANDVILYIEYLYRSGYGSSCSFTDVELAKQLNISEKALAKSKLKLSRPFSLLKGKSLIRITPKELNDGVKEVVLIMNIWPENFEYFNTKNESK